MTNQNSSNTIGIRATSFRVPEPYIPVSRLMAENEAYVKHIREDVLQIPKLKALTLEEIDGVHEFTDEAPGDLLTATIKELLAEEGISGKEISLILDFSTCSRDKNGISLCYRIQHEIEADHALTIALGNGSCSSLQLAFKMAVSLMKTEPHITYALLIAEDRVDGKRYHPPAHVLGDGTSVVLLEKEAACSQVLDTAYAAIGRFSNIMGVNHRDEGNYDIGEFENRVIPMHYKVIGDLIADILERNELGLEQIDLFLYHNMCQNDYDGLISMLKIDGSKVFQDGLRGHGHILASDLIVNYHLAEKQGLLSPGAHVLLISSGAGFSWGVTLIKR